VGREEELLRRLDFAVTIERPNDFGECLPSSSSNATRFAGAVSDNDETSHPQVLSCSLSANAEFVDKVSAAFEQHSLRRSLAQRPLPCGFSCRRHADQAEYQARASTTLPNSRSELPEFVRCHCIFILQFAIFIFQSPGRKTCVFISPCVPVQKVEGQIGHRIRHRRRLPCVGVKAMSNLAFDFWTARKTNEHACFSAGRLKMKIANCKMKMQ